MDRSELEALLGRVEKASGPDREIDLAFGRMTNILVALQDQETGVVSSHTYRRFTESVDDALWLVDDLRKEGEGQPHDWSFGILQSAMVAAWDSWIATKMAPELDASGGWLAELPRAIVAELLRTMLASHPAEPLKHMPA